MAPMAAAAQTGVMEPSRPRAPLPALVRVGVVVGVVSLLVMATFTVPLFREPVVMLARVEKVDVCDEGDPVDAYASRYENFHCMRFQVLGVLKGSYAKSELGLILHSPTLTFWGLASPGAWFLLAFREHPVQGRTVLELVGQQWVP